MSGGFDIELATFDTLIARLLEGADALADAGTSAPTTVTSGLGGAATAEMVQHLLRNAGNLCAALEVSAAGVGDSRDDYAAADARAAGGGRPMQAI